MQSSMQNLQSLIRIAFTTLLLTRLTSGGWTVFVKAVCWEGTGNDNDGVACDPLGDCDQQFIFCLRPYGTTGSDTTNCPFQSAQTGEFDIADSFCFFSTYVDQQNSVPNPIPFTNTGSYPGMFQLFVNVLDIDITFHDLIANIFIDMVLDPSDSFTSTGTYGSGNGGSITLQFRAECSDNFYDNNCATFCIDTNDDSGHYTCGEDGEKVCLPGWSDPSTNCITANCANCNPAGGNCIAPDLCSCNPGWSGIPCDQCQVLQGCVNGNCTVPDECHCDDNWGGPLCDIDLVPCDTNPPCLQGGTCVNNGFGGYSCTCPPGYAGINCGTEVLNCETNPCQNGGVCSMSGGMVTCTSCQNGCSGSLCEICVSECVVNPCENGAICQVTSNGPACVCPPGYSGDLCEIAPCDLDPCISGSTCFNMDGEALCICSSGMGSDCHKACNPNQCDNGGICTATPSGGLQFTCTCLPGYTGLLCHVDVSPSDPTDTTSAASASTETAVGENDSLLIVAVVVSLGGVLIVIVLVVVVAACVFVRRSRKQRPPLAIDLSDIAPAPANGHNISPPDNEADDISKTDLSPPHYDDI